MERLKRFWRFFDRWGPHVMVLAIVAIMNLLLTLLAVTAAVDGRYRDTAIALGMIAVWGLVGLVTLWFFEASRRALDWMFSKLP